MFKFFKNAPSKTDKQLEDCKRAFEDKLLVEALKTKINRHKVFWVGRSQHDDKEIRIGIEFASGSRYFYDWSTFKSDPRIASYEVMTSAQADELERQIKEKQKK